ncbi:CheR family methyltransferase [Oceanidesulfovibrio marinus]|uniref:protein-glutamate O-methyltransferase n=1 Tax=Oceanidesulfovibrio marinus TaxID=370038 RepID=A0A6P1ZGY4_9BACT|nr:CheR family methyltransferase [Oceanidesulfovibrio marinus]TVM31932.1 hypothetical protein DQK91_17160 [Oceanidesulfovibrio marinus]
MTEKKRTGETKKGKKAGRSTFPAGVLYVGIGASAGGLEPLFQIVEQLSPDDPCAYFIVQHQSMETGESLLPSLLAKRTDCSVELADDGARIMPGVIYIAPPDKLLSFNGILISLSIQEARTMPIDHLFRSLAENAGGHCIAIILSGSNTDGTLGSRAVKEHGGVIIAQDPDTAEYKTMPQSVVDTGLADLMAAPSAIPNHIRDYVNTVSQRDASETDTIAFSQSQRNTLFSLVKNRVGHDFQPYKENTINRRIQRRMDFHKIERLKDYITLVKSDPNEANELFKDMLISVTNFFRDPACFETLKQTLVKQYLPRKNSAEFRAWVPGCATGEEAYSLAIILAEAMDETGVHCDVSIYATDVDTEAIARARKGVFPENIEADVSEQRLRRFFSHQSNEYRIKQKIRDMIIFAEQNVRQDPPFYRLDTIICRNLLMYFKPEAQQKVMSHFCYAMKKNGLLMLGTSESIGSLAECLHPVDASCRLYMAKRGIEDHERYTDSHTSQRLFSLTGAPAGGYARRRQEDSVGESGIRSMERILLNLATPPSLIVNRNGDIHYIHGRTGKLLEPVQGRPDSNVLRMAREGLRMHLSTLLGECAHTNQKQTRRNVRVQTNGDETLFDITIQPIKSDQFEAPTFLISFDESPPPRKGELDIENMQDISEQARNRITMLEAELQECRDSMRVMTEEHEAANEELKSSNEELQSTNEELKSTVEELETAKEEVQSINEEQSTLNEELQAKNDELQRISNDLDNLLVSTEIATIFLNNDLIIKRYTPAISDVMSLRESDVGRPVTDIAMKLEYTALAVDSSSVLQNLDSLTKEVQNESGSWFQMRIRPYKTSDNRIDGVVVTFNDITRLKQSEQMARTAQNLAESIIDIASEPLLVLDEKMVIQTANRALLETFGVTEKKSIGKNIFEVGRGRLDQPELKKALESLITEKHVLWEYPIKVELKPSRTMRLHINAKYVPFSTQEGEAPRILLSISAITPLDSECPEPPPEN